MFRSVKKINTGRESIKKINEFDKYKDWTESIGNGLMPKENAEKLKTCLKTMAKIEEMKMRLDNKLKEEKDKFEKIKEKNAKEMFCIEKILKKDLNIEDGEGLARSIECFFDNKIMENRIKYILKENYEKEELWDIKEKIDKKIKEKDIIYFPRAYTILNQAMYSITKEKEYLKNKTFGYILSLATERKELSRKEAKNIAKELVKEYKKLDKEELKYIIFKLGMMVRKRRHFNEEEDGMSAFQVIKYMKNVGLIEWIKLVNYYHEIIDRRRS